MQHSPPRHRGVRLAFAAAAVWAMAVPAPAGAIVDGPCVASFNGVPVEEIESISSPLELQADDVLTFFGTDDVGTRQARVELQLIGFRLDDGSTTYGPVQAEFSASLDLTDTTTYGVGLYRIRGYTDNCTAEAWLRISGRFPLATLTGLTAAGLALGGITAQVSALVTRGRLAHITAGLGGIATGLGGALLGQQFGRLQLSYPAILAAILAASGIGVIIGSIVRPKVGPGWFERRRIAAAEYRSRVAAEQQSARERADRTAAQRAADQTAAEQAATERRARESREAQVAAVAAAAEREERATEEARARALAERQASEAEADRRAQQAVVAAGAQGDTSAYWCYVMAPTDVFDLTDHTRIVARLEPGKWYLARREVGGWVHVVVTDGGEGWVGRASVHRQG